MAKVSTTRIEITARRATGVWGNTGFVVFDTVGYLAWAFGRTDPARDKVERWPEPQSVSERASARGFICIPDQLGKHARSFISASYTPINRHRIFPDESSSGYAVAICAASSRPISLMEISRILYFWVLPLMVMGKESTNLM